MTADLTEAVQRCDIYQQTRPALTKEPLMTYPIPNLPWQIVGSDCFECDGSHYLIVVDLYSDYIEIKQLNSLSSAASIEQLKQIFAVHEIPMTLISDNGPNYYSKEFTDFTHDWDIQHVTSSPHHPKGNGKAESAVKIMKSIISKANKQEHRCVGSYLRMEKFTHSLSRQLPSLTPYVTQNKIISTVQGIAVLA